MSGSQFRRLTFAKVAVILAAIFGVGVGLCGLDYALGARGIGKSTEELGVGPLDSLSLLVMGLSGLALVLVLIVWALAYFSLRPGGKG